MIRIRAIDLVITSCRSFPVMLLSVLLMRAWGACAFAGVIPVSSPAGITNGTTITFDEYADYSIANTLFENEGFTFTRDDGEPIYLFNWTGLNRVTPSPSNVLATIRRMPPDLTWATHLNVIANTPVSAIGAYFGNDQYSDLASVRLSAFGITGQLLGSVQVAVNNNTDVDQFIGLRSDAPIGRVRFENLTAEGTPSESLSVVIDDLVFSTVGRTARETKQSVLNELVALHSETTNRLDASKLDHAIKHLEKSMAAMLWVDEMHLDHALGQRVFHQEELAAGVLCAWMKSGKGSTPSSVIQGFIDGLLQADRMLTVTAIEDAIAVGLPARRIEQAQQFLIDGDTQNDGTCHNAIKAYQRAWKRVTP